MNKVWDDILSDLRQSVRHEEVEIWFGEAQFVEAQGQDFIVEVPNKYYVEWIEENYQGQLDQSASKLLTEININATHVEGIFHLAQQHCLAC